MAIFGHIFSNQPPVAHGSKGDYYDRGGGYNAQQFSEFAALMLCVGPKITFAAIKAYAERLEDSLAPGRTPLGPDDPEAMRIHECLKSCAPLR